MPRRKAHTLVLLRPFASPPLRWFYLLSCDERPRGSLPAFAWDDVATPIHPITRWRSLCPQSFARIAMGKALRLAVPEGSDTGFPRSACESMSGQAPAVDRAAYGSRERVVKTLFPPPLPFWLKRNSHFRLFRITTFIADSHVFAMPTV